MNNTPRTAPIKTPLLLLLALACTWSCAKHGQTLPRPDEDAGRFMFHGNHEVGFKSFEYQRENQPTLMIQAWYPVRTQDQSWPDMTYDIILDADGLPNGPAQVLGNGHPNAEPNTDEQYPLVVFSHGFGANPEWYHQIPEHLASHGLVVLAPQHTEFGWADDLVETSARRPLEISATIDFAEGEVLEGIIDTSRVSAVGHSYGGYSVLAVAGARVFPEELDERCGRVLDPIKKTYFCKPLVGHEDALANAMGFDETPAGLWPAQRDERIYSIVTMSGDAYVFGEGGLAAVEIPVLALGGTDDTGTHWDWGTGLTFENVSGPKTLAAFDGAEHMLPATSCERMPWTEELGYFYHGAICNEDGWEKAAGLAYVNQVTAAFILATLNDNEAAREVLEKLQTPGVEGLEVVVD